MPASLKIFCGDTQPHTNLRIGSRLDKYRLIGRLGEGGFATVFAALDTIEERKVAIKIPDRRYVTNSQTMDDMQREVRIMARLQHPGVLALKDARFIDGHFVKVTTLFGVLLVGGFVAVALLGGQGETTVHECETVVATPAI